MDSKIKENAGFYAVGVLSTIIAILGITANTVYLKNGGYALGVGLSFIALVCEFFVFAVSPKIVKVRAKGIIASSIIMTLIYAIAFIVSDIANVKAYVNVFESGVFISKLTGFGKFVFAFEILCMVYLALSGIRMLLNLFGKEFKFYEKILGTEVVRYKEKSELVLDLPEKDTDKLITNAKRTLNSNQKLVKALEESVVVEDEPPLVEKSVKPQPIENKIVREVVKEIEQEEQAVLENNEIEQEETENKNAVDMQESEQSTVEVQESEQIEEAEQVDENERNEDETQDESEQADEQETDQTEEDVPSELYADSEDVGGVVNEYEQNEDFRNTCLVHHITEQVENADDDIYNDFDYDD